MIHTDRLLIRRFTLEDAEAFLPLVSDPDVLRFTGEPGQPSVAAARDIIAGRPLRDYAMHGFGRMACIERSSGRLIGACGLKFLEDLQEIDIGFRFLRGVWGNGYATESAQAIIRHGSKTYGFARIIGLVHPDNVASAGVLSKLGLVFEKTVSLADYSFELDLHATAHG